MYYSQAFLVEFYQDDQAYRTEVKAQSREDASAYVTRAYRDARVFRISNISREEAVAALGNLLLLEANLIGNPQEQKLIKSLISAFIAVSNTEYHDVVYGYPTDNFKTLAKKLISHMAKGIKHY